MGAESTFVCCDLCSVFLLYHIVWNISTETFGNDNVYSWGGNLDFWADNDELRTTKANSESAHARQKLKILL